LKYIKLAIKKPFKRETSDISVVPDTNTHTHTQNKKKLQQQGTHKIYQSNTGAMTTIGTPFD
jgi:hypothetical protein